MKRLRFSLITGVLLILMIVIAGTTLAAPPKGSGPAVFVNELHYDNTGTDTGEAIEVAGPAGTDLSGWSIALYNGSASQLNVYGTIALTGTLPDGGSGCGTLFFERAGIQNGSPDGFALLDPDGAVVQFLSYEGAFTAGSGPAAGMTSVDIGVSEASGTPVGYSLQLTGSGSTYDDFTWAAAAAHTFGAANTGQTFAGCEPVTPPSGPATFVVINEVDADTPGSDSLEFIELYDGGVGNTDLSGLVVVRYNGSDDRSYSSGIDLDGYSTNADGYFLLGNPGVSPAVDITFGGNGLQNGADAVALYVGDGTDFPDDTPITFDGLLDAVVYDTYDSDDAGLLVLLNAGQPQLNEGGNGDKDNHSNQRCPNGEGGQRNTAGWLQDVATPGAENACDTGGGIPAFGVCGDPATAIHAVQGNGLASPLVDSVGVIVEGVVVGDFQGSSGLRGFHLQEEDGEADADPATSEGVFIYDNYFGTDVSIGDVVRVQGDVTEYYNLTEINNVINLTVCGSGASVTPAVVTLPVASIDDFEAFEGMLVTFPQQLTATETYTLGRYGQVSLSVNGRLPNPTHIAAPGEPANAQADLNDRSRIELDDGNNWQNKDPITHPFPGLTASNTLRGGSTVTGLVGVLDYSFGIYRIQPVGDVIFSYDNPRSAAPDPVGGTLTVASFNVLNYFNGDGLGGGFPTSRGADSAGEFTRQRDKIVAAILAMDADVIGLMEIENDGYGPYSAIADLVNGLNAVAGPATYAYIDPGVPVIGTDEIAVGFIYRPAAVTPVGASAILDSSVDPLFDDTKNRPALAQTFQENATGGRFTAVVNHLKSKGSSCASIGDPDLNDGQGNCNLTRTNAASALANWLTTDPTGSNDPDFLIIGDLNSYAMEDPITALKDAGYIDLAASYLGAGAYSYVFDGEWGYLDYALSNGSLTGQVTGVTQWHINADEPPVLDYNVEYKSSGQVTSLYSPDAYRASDHDPVVVGLALTTEQEVREIIDAVQALVDGGTLNNGQGNALTAKLDNVLAKLAKGNVNPAANELGAFVNQVDAYVKSGLLTTEQGDALIEAAKALIVVLGD